MAIHHTSRKTLAQYFLGIGSICMVALLPGSFVWAGDSMTEAAQAAFGGAEYNVWGTITKIDKDNFWIKKPDGSEVSLKVTEGTNMVCGAGKGESEDKVQSSHEKDASAGFRIGECPPEKGMFVEAETTDEGMVTFLKTVEEDELKSRTEELGLPQGYNPQNPTQSP
jgi:hypothetical protein